MAMKHIAVILLTAALCAGTALRAGIVVYPDYPEQIERDYAYAVRVVQGDVKKPLVVYNHCEKSILNPRTRGGDVNRRFCEFAFSGESVRVDIRVTEDVRCYKVFPSRLRLKSAFKDGVISVWLDRPSRTRRKIPQKYPQRTPPAPCTWTAGLTRPDATASSRRARR